MRIAKRLKWPQACTSYHMHTKETTTSSGRRARRNVLINREVPPFTKVKRVVLLLKLDVDDFCGNFLPSTEPFLKAEMSPCRLPARGFAGPAQ